ncbi:GNAT family N-acetyltransferase [Marinomonas sp. PE14-40]|uniref:GNAT family N-acetyltransferase n=1 Tax=Marinomonas sp. PE14-40 TaxID=3060621 RepID=UPI003F67D722
MIIQAITWQECLPIRQQVLWPHRPEIFCQIEEDKDAKHYGVFIDNQLVSVASLYFKTINGICRVRLRKFATITSYQRKGIGRKLLSHIIQDLASSGVDYFWCDARKDNQNFYLNLGFKVIGQSFYKFDIEYHKFEIKLN